MRWAVGGSNPEPGIKSASYVHAVACRRVLFGAVEQDIYGLPDGFGWRVVKAVAAGWMDAKWTRSTAVAAPCGSSWKQ